MISRSAQYALRAVLYVAQRVGAGPVRAADAADALGLPPNYLRKVLHDLSRAGVLRSMRGPRGGFELGAPAAELTLGEVVAPFESGRENGVCVLGSNACGGEATCVAHERWKRALEGARAFFRETTVAALLPGAVAGVRNTGGGG